MPEDNVGLSVTVSTRLIKFGVGVDPEIGEPFEIIENSHVYTGDEAKAIMASINKESEPDVLD